MTIKYELAPDGPAWGKIYCTGGRRIELDEVVDMLTDSVAWMVGVTAENGTVTFTHSEGITLDLWARALSGGLDKARSEIRA